MHSVGADANSGDAVADLPCGTAGPTRTRRSRLAFVAFALCLGGAGPSMPAGPPPDGADRPAQAGYWRQAVERPLRGWDYDGERILGHVGEEVRLWDAETGELIRTPGSHREDIHAVQLGPDGRRGLSSSWIGPGPLGYVSRDTRVILWDLETGRRLHMWPGQVAGEFSPDGGRVVTFSQRPGVGVPDPDRGGGAAPVTGAVRQTGSWPAFDAAVWDVETGRWVATATLDEYANPTSATLHVSPDGHRFVYLEMGRLSTVMSGGAVRFDAGDGRETGRVAWDDVELGQGHRYASNGTLATFSQDSAQRIDLGTGRVVWNVRHGLRPGEFEYFWGAAWTHDGGRVAAIPAGDEAIQILDAATGTTIRGANGGPDPKTDAIVSPDDRRLAIEWGGANDVPPGVGLYDMTTGAAVARLALPEWGHMISFSPDGKTFLTGGSEFKVYDAATGGELRTLKLLGEVGSSFGWD